MKGRNECTHFGKSSEPPKEANCWDCQDITACRIKARLTKGKWIEKKVIK